MHRLTGMTLLWWRQLTFNPMSKVGLPGEQAWHLHTQDAQLLCSICLLSVPRDAVSTAWPKLSPVLQILHEILGGPQEAEYSGWSA